MSQSRSYLQPYPDVNDVVSFCKEHIFDLAYDDGALRRLQFGIDKALDKITSGNWHGASTCEAVKFTPDCTICIICHPFGWTFIILDPVEIIMS